MKKNFTEIEIPFGVKDSELYQFTYTIPDGYSAEIKDGKVIVKKKRESEDERIRNEIIDYLNFAESHNLLRAAEYDKKKGWLAYLEKQKDEVQRQFNLGVQAGREEVLYEMDKEQKPTEWSEEEKKVLDSIINDYEKATKSFCGYDGKIVLLKAIRDGEYDLPKQEWSDEDKKILYEIIRNVSAYDAYIGTTYLQPERHDKKINFLRTLRPSWKPSAQEKWALRTAIHVFIKERNLPKAAAQLQNILDTFEGKESRKDWKPSEEQMDALDNARFCKSYDRSELDLLYEDLKKL